MESEILYNKYYPVIYRFVYRMIGEPENSKDITQETFFRLHKFLTEGNQLENPASWLYKVAANLSRNQIKKTVLKRNILSSEFDQDQISHKPDYQKKERVELIRSALEQIPARDRVILQLYLDGLSYAEMADVAEMNVNSIGKTLSRAIKKVSALLKGEKVK